MRVPHSYRMMPSETPYLLFHPLARVWSTVVVTRCSLDFGNIIPSDVDLDRVACLYCSVRVPLLIPTSNDLLCLVSTVLFDYLRLSRGRSKPPV